MPIYRDYDQAALDAQYNNRARVADALTYMERWASQSATVRKDLPCQLDLSYGDHPRHQLDIFNGPGRAAPTLVFIHGGYWQMLDKSSHSFPAPAVTGAGVNYVTVSYPLAPEVPIATIVASIRRAMVWLWQHGADHDLDPARLYVCGHSAGGHLTAMTMATDWARLDADLPGNLIKAGCGISGLYEMEPIRLSYLNEVLAIGPDDLDHISPDRNLVPRLLHLAVGGAESEEFLRQTSDFRRTWDKNGGRAEELVVTGANHFSVIDGLADRESDLFGLLTSMTAGE